MAIALLFIERLRIEKNDAPTAIFMPATSMFGRLANSQSEALDFIRCVAVMVLLRCVFLVLPDAMPGAD
ncbi:MAG: hypothetical protein EA377_11450 [Phycisphaerales bacterium]|nr:MAG: hypothetical protein EA377_11450 [Phycisphaerales bacterium]